MYIHMGLDLVFPARQHEVLNVIVCGKFSMLYTY